MTEAASFLLLPALACIALVGIHAYFGLQVLERNVIFVDLALAQVAALGATVAFLVGHPPQGLAAHGYALAFTLAAAAFLASTRRWSSRLPQEAQIGVLYVVAAAAALLAVDRAPQGAEHIRQILTGNILTVGWEELRWALALYVVVGLAHPFVARALERRRPGHWSGDFAFYAAFGLVVTSSVALAGVLLVFTFLIIPAAIGVLYGATRRARLAIAWIAGAAIAIVGLAVSYRQDLSTGATLVCTYGAALAIAGIARLGAERIARAARWGTGAALVASAAWIVAVPRADQPLLDALERMYPALRALYMDEKSLALAADAESYEARYRVEAEKLRAREAERRWKGAPLDELEVGKIAAFLKSYNEMMQGERFVVQEVRARERERRRGWIGAVLMLAAGVAVPWRPTRWRTPRRAAAPQPGTARPEDAGPRADR
jgi:zinc/manganese transport system permease protein